MNSKKFKFWISYINNIGYISFFHILVNKLLSQFLKFKFQKCNSLTFLGYGRISGCKYISINTLSLGGRYRIEALSNFGGEKFSPTLIFGSKVSFGNDLHIGCIDSIIIGNNVLGGSGITIMDHDHGVYGNQSLVHSVPDSIPAYRVLSHSPIIIEDNVYIGERVIILQGVRIGKGSVIGSGSVVVKDVPTSTIVGGVPAKIIKSYSYESSKWMKMDENG